MTPPHDHQISTRYQAFAGNACQRLGHSETSDCPIALYQRRPFRSSCSLCFRISSERAVCVCAQATMIAPTKDTGAAYDPPKDGLAMEAKQLTSQAFATGV